MDKANKIKNKLHKLYNEDKLEKLFLDEENTISIILDLETIVYRGIYIKFFDEEKVIEINTAVNSLKVNDQGKISRSSLDTATRKSLDKIAVEKFNFNKLDDDYFTDLEESIEEEIVDLANKESKDIYKKLVAILKEIHKSDYDKDLIIKNLKRFDIIEKKDHYNLERTIGRTKIKYNSSKNKFTVKNQHTFKEKFTFKDLIANFDTGAFLEVIKNYYRKKSFDERRLSLDDAFIDTYPVFAHSAALGDKDKDKDDK